jgi:hypothetical protein
MTSRAAASAAAVGVPRRIRPRARLASIFVAEHADADLERLLGPRAAPAEHVQADPAGHRGEPAAQVPDVAGTGRNELGLTPDRRSAARFICPPGHITRPTERSPP